MAVELNQRRPFAELRSDDKPGAEAYPAARVVNYHVTTPLEHWASNDAVLPPRGTAGRVQQLREFRRLYDGDMDVILRSLYGVRVNYFRRLSNSLSDLLLSYPPIIQSAPDGVDVDALQEDVFEALEGSTVDLSRFGTCLLRAYRDEDGPHIEDVQTEKWFPAGKSGDAIISDLQVGRMSSQTEVMLLPKGQPETRVSFISASNADFAAALEPDGLSPGLSLGRRTGETELAPAFRLEGQTLFTVPLRPATGPWGQSLYPPLYGLVAELCRRLSKQSHILNRHADPMMIFRRNPNAPTPATRSPGQKQAIETYAQRVFLDEFREHWIQVVPPQFDDVSYLSWDAQMQASFNHYDRVRDELYATSALLPIALLTKDSAQFGNVSLRKAFPGVYAFLLRTQARFHRALTRACSAACRGDVVIEWPNALEEFDKQVITNIGVSAGQEAEETVGMPSRTGDPVEISQPVGNGAMNGAS